MKKFLKKKLGNEKGMTLIELLAVIVILAIIAAIAIPAIGNIIENSRYGAIKGDVSNIMAAADIFYADGNDDGGDGEVTVTDLKTAGYLDDSGSFEEATVTKGDLTATPVTSATISGDAVVGNVELTFTNATREDANSIKPGLDGLTTVEVTPAGEG